MKGKDYQEEEIFSEDSIIETIFKYNREWMAMIVKPFSQQGKIMHYIVKLIGGPIILVKKDDRGSWIDLKEGITERSQAIGKAIEYSFL